MQRRISQECKQSIGLQAITENNISQVAQRHQVSRNTVYTQKNRIQTAVNDAFMTSEAEDRVLFNMPVTKPFLQQVVLGILLICKGSYRNAQMFLTNLFDTDMSIGTIFNIHDAACHKAAEINGSYNLASITHSASDETYHRNKPHLAVVDVKSRYCASLTSEDACDSDTWAIHLLDLIDQGFQPVVNISDQGPGMTRAFKDILPDTEHRFDHFHLLKACKELVRYLKNKKESAVTHHVNLLVRMERAKKKGQGHTLSSTLNQANKNTIIAEATYQHVSTLSAWLQHDILQLPGHNPTDRERLFDFVLEELASVADACHRVRKFVVSLTHQKSYLLAASHVLNREFQQMAIHYRVTTQDIWDVCYVTRYGVQTQSYHTKADTLASRLGPQFEEIEDEVLKFIATTPRCSSMVENFNSRLRPYLDSRKEITSASLALIQFYLNHHVFLRSKHAYMQGKTPAEVMAGISHPNWLEMLGFQCFKQAA